MLFSKADIRSSMRLYAVTDSAWLKGRSLAECVQEAVEGGATFVQLREKSISTADMVQLAKTILPICRKAGVPFVINDDVEAARIVGADGVHVGQSDAACADARAILGPDAIIGVSADTVEDALAAQVAGADYLGVAVYGTATKPEAAEVGSEGLAAVCAAVDIPVVAIGGMNERTIPGLAGTGFDGAAVVSAIFAAEDIPAASRRLRQCVDATVAG